MRTSLFQKNPHSPLVRLTARVCARAEGMVLMVVASLSLSLSLSLSHSLTHSLTHSLSLSLSLPSSQAISSGAVVDTTGYLVRAIKEVSYLEKMLLQGSKDILELSTKIIEKLS